MAMAPPGRITGGEPPATGHIGIRRHFTAEGVDPYDAVIWERRDSRITNVMDGSVAFEQKGVEVPTTWSLNATNILAQKYFRGTLGTPEREHSLRQVADRVVDTVTGWGARQGYFADDAEVEAFQAELKFLIVTQRAAFNSPVWFNIGVAGVPQQASACQPYDALVCTPAGLVPIGHLVESEVVGTKVLDAHGLTRIVATKANGRRPVLRVRTASGQALDVTADHLVWRAAGVDAGAFVPAGELAPGDLLEWHRTDSWGGEGEISRTGDVELLEVTAVDDVGERQVYDIQTESGEYLSGNLRVHNCFILSVEDSLPSILNWYAEEGTIFKGGSGSGVNLSKIRSSIEPLEGGGIASGPVSFMRGADASAGTIRSGGKTRRAAKMVILNADHPDIEDFIWCKALEERKARVLRDAGFDMGLDGKDSHSLQYQNANNSVRVTDEFMQAVLDDADWDLKAVTTGEVVKTIKARDLMRQIADATWECADPGMQFDTTINRWHTAANTGRINASNPCSEYLHLDDSACNLASINLLHYLDEAGRFDVEGFVHTVEVVFTAQEILVGNADYPTESIAETSRRFRQLGLGYANLGALLMALGLPYDSDEGRAWAGAITSLMTGHAYATSARTAARMGPFAGFTENAEHMLRVLRMHRDAAAEIDEELVPPVLLGAAQQAWDEAVALGETHGVRNSQATVLAPTGCLVGGTLVPTERGLVRLHSLGDPDAAQWQRLGIDVMTDEGARRASRFYVNGLERVVDVVTARGHRIAGTVRHRIKVVDAAGTWAWRRFADLVPGDRVPLALDQLVGVPRRIALPVPGKLVNDVLLPEEMTVELAELVGYALGSGVLEVEGLRCVVPAADLDVAERLRVLAKTLFGVDAAVTGSTGRLDVTFPSSALSSWWRACRFHEAIVPNAVLASNDRRIYGAFVRGLFEAAGSVAGGMPSWSTAEVGFSQEVQAVLLALGLPTSRKFDRGEAVLRLTGSSFGARWLDEVGFLGDRKNAAVTTAGVASGADHIPVPPAIVEALVPSDDPTRSALVRDAARGALSRAATTELYERTGDVRLRHLLGFFYDTVASAILGNEELTYDLSVPDNVTYLANGFVSHNTIGLLMDCDTTGVEPDLGLCKMKKLVGGGTMTIVNRTVPRALRRLGYSAGQQADIVAYVDEHKSILGAPHLTAEHVPVFACSMGDNPIHHMGHIKMLGAVQPWISGSVSKTCNVPEETTVEELEQLHIDAWKLGVKSVAVYRDNCKVGQPLATTKREVKAIDVLSAVPAAELVPAQVVDRIVERVVKEPVWEKLPRSRRSRTLKFRVADCKGFVTVGEYDDGRPGEIFMRVSKQGSTLAGIMDSFAIAVSFGLQYGVPLKAFVEQFTNMRFEPAGMTDDPDIRFATSLVDYIFRRLAVDYLPLEERMEIGILSVGERVAPTLPGIEEAVTETVTGLDVVASPPAENTTAVDLDPMVGTATALRPAPRTASHDAPYCMQCGVQMIRAGSCHACPSCGTTSGCS